MKSKFISVGVKFSLKVREQIYRSQDKLMLQSVMETNGIVYTK